MKRTGPNPAIVNKRNSLNINSQVYQQLLKKLNAVQPSPGSAGAQGRNFARLEYAEPYLTLVVNSDDHNLRREITVATRNISRGGISVLHSSYIYPGTTVSASLRRINGSAIEVTGKVCRCEHRGGIVHEFGIQFDEQIIVQEFVRASIDACVRSLETADPSILEGNVLFVGSDPEIIPPVREYLLKSNIQFGFVNTAKEALGKELGEQSLIFSCLDAGDMTGLELARELRKSGFRKPIILSGKIDSDKTKHQLSISSADMFMPIPFTEIELHCALGEFLTIPWTEDQLETLRMVAQSDTLNMLHVKLADLGDTLDQQRAINDPVQAHITCTNIRNAAESLGLKSLHELTHSVCEQIASSGDLSAFEPKLSQIKQMCARSREAA